jgi:1-acyl-sn-glycerol-3-phosphate acyltransferase
VQLLRSLLFYVGLAAATLLFVPLCFVIRPIPFVTRFRIVSRWSVFNLWWLRISCGLSHVVEGLENIPREPCVILCKHQSAWETLALQMIFPAQVWVLKRELLRIPIYGWGLATMEPIAIDRAAGMKSLKFIAAEGKRWLDRGIWVVVFPEGTRVPPGERRRYQAGGALLAVESGRKIVPVAHNSGWFWPKNSLRKKPGVITMRIGPPIESVGREADQLTQLAEDWIEGAAVELLERVAGS